MSELVQNEATFETKVNILLVDDNSANLLALSAVLNGPSYTLMTATSGVEALRFLLKTEFAVVLLDVMMPGMDGFEVAHIMKSREATKHTPIIFVTAEATEVQYIFQGYAVGAVDYIRKPFDPQIIRSKVAVFADLYRKNQLILNSEKAEFLKKEQEGRLRAEKAEMRFKELANSLDHAIIWEANFDLSFFTFVSDRAQILLGYPQEKWHKEKNFFLNHLPPIDQVEIMAVLNRIRTSTSRADPLGERCEHRIITSDGTERWFHTGIQYLFNESRVPIGMRGLSVDIHALKGIEHELRDSQDKLAFALAAGNMGLWDWNLVTGNLIVSETVKGMFGFSSINFPKNLDSIRERIHPGDREMNEAALKQALENREPYDVEYRIVNPKGKIVWVSSKGKVFFDSFQKPIRMAGTILDITEKKEINEREQFLNEATLQLSTTLNYEETLRKIAELLVPRFASWCIIDLIENQNLRRAIVHHRNPALAELASKFEKMPVSLDVPTGAPKAIHTGQSVLFPSDEKDLEQLEGDEVPMLGTRDLEQLKIIRRLGIQSYVSVLIQTRQVRLGVITLVRSDKATPYKPKDVRFAEDLASRAALAIDNARLFAKSQDAIKTREDVIALLSHDLKTPLSAIAMNCKLLEKMKATLNLDEKYMNLFHGIYKSSSRMTDLINNILDVTKMEAGGFLVETHEENINSIIEDVFELVQADASQKSVHLENNVDPDCTIVFCDRQQLLRVLMNLVSNAIKFLPEKGKVTVSTKKVDHEVQISVEDTGPGISLEQQKHVFDRFWQAKETSRKGTGLGLAIVKGIVEAHQGKVWVESEPGHGSTFCFRLPQPFLKAA